MPKFKFVGTGTHADNHPSDGRNRIYKHGDIIETKSDLLKLNSVEKQDKFIRVSDDIPSSNGLDTGNPLNNPPAPPVQNAPVPSVKTPPPGGDTYDSMTVQELITFANAEEIDISKIKKDKESLVKALRAAG